MLVFLAGYRLAFPGEKTRVHPIFALHLQVLGSSPILTESIQDRPRTQPFDGSARTVSY